MGDPTHKRICIIDAGETERAIFEITEKQKNHRKDCRGGGRNNSEIFGRLAQGKSATLTS